MRPKHSVLRCFVLIVVVSLPLVTPLYSIAQQWTGILAPARAMDWSNVGATIVNRTTVCAHFTSSATVTDINSAIASCPDGQVVELAAGTYSLTSGIVFDNKSNVTLRGAGPDQTILSFSGNASCFGLLTAVCVKNGDGNYSGGPSNSANWTAGYTKGATTITLSSTTNLAIGSLLALDQLNDTADTGNIFICSATGTCSNAGPGGAGRTGRELHQLVRVTGINGLNVTISPGIVMPNFRSGKSPGAWWSNTVVSGVGIEALQIDQSLAGNNGVIFTNAYNCWVKNIHSRWPGTRSHVWVYGSKNITVRDSYFYEGKSHASQSYGIETFTAADIRIENNIFQKVTAPVIFNGTGHGSVVAYNYMREMTYATPAWMIPSNDHHATGVGYVLHEGNIGTGLIFDNVHGPGAMITAFRNHWKGLEPGQTAQTIPVHLYHYSRYFNFIGNVLGTSGYHTTYECSPTTTTSTSCGAGVNISIYTFGWSGNGGQYAGTNGLNDTKVATTVMRWGNYDSVNAATRFVSIEVPSGETYYPNAVPASQTLPSSFYLSAKPSFFGSQTWPGIGPDVSGGDLIGVGGHAWRNPANVCYDNSTKDGNGLLTNFNANICYGGGQNAAPTAPVNLKVQ